MSQLSATNPESFFEVIDGWGGNLHDGGVDDAVQPAAEHQYNKANPSATAPLACGAMVFTTVTAGVKECKQALLDTEVQLDSDKRAKKQFWMVVEGNTEYQYSGRIGKGKCVLLRGQYTVRTRHVKGSLSVGDGVCPEYGTSGTVAATLPFNSVSSVPGINTGRLVAAGSGDPILGRVSQVITDEDGNTTYEIEMSH